MMNRHQGRSPDPYAITGWMFLLWVVMVNVLYFLQFRDLIRHLLGI